MYSNLTILFYCCIIIISFTLLLLIFFLFLLFYIFYFWTVINSCTIDIKMLSWLRLYFKGDSEKRKCIFIFKRTSGSYLILIFPWPSRMRNIQYIHSSSPFSLSCSAVTRHLPKQILLNIVHLLQRPNMQYQGFIQFIIVGSRQLLETVDQNLICIFSDNFSGEWEIQLQDKGCWENLYDSLPVCRE